jgi:hypothetical protein
MQMTTEGVMYRQITTAAVASWRQVGEAEAEWIIVAYSHRIDNPILSDRTQAR